MTTDVASTATVTVIGCDGHPLPLAQWSGIFGVPGGKDVSPELSWYGFPKQTKSFVVSMYDPQAPTQAGFFHWIVEDIPATTTHLPQNAGALGRRHPTPVRKSLLRRRHGSIQIRGCRLGHLGQDLASARVLDAGAQAPRAFTPVSAVVEIARLGQAQCGHGLSGLHVHGCA